jgi:hypothetical protein
MGLEPRCLCGHNSQRPFQRRPSLGENSVLPVVGDVVRLEAADFGEALQDSLDAGGVDQGFKGRRVRIGLGLGIADWCDQAFAIE